MLIAHSCINVERWKQRCNCYLQCERDVWKNKCKQREIHYNNIVQEQLIRIMHIRFNKQQSSTINIINFVLIDSRC